MVSYPTFLQAGTLFIFLVASLTPLTSSGGDDTKNHGPCLQTVLDELAQKKYPDISRLHGSEPKLRPLPDTPFGAQYHYDDGSIDFIMMSESGKTQVLPRSRNSPDLSVSRPSDISVASTLFPFPEMQGVLLKKAGGNYTYRLTNIGTRQQTRDLPTLDAALDKAHPPNLPWSNFRIITQGQRREGNLLLSRFRDKVFQKVLSIYDRTKSSYLTSFDRNMLKVGQSAATDSDIFVILKNRNHPIEKMTPQEFEQSALITIEVAYSSGRNPLNPTRIDNLYSGNGPGDPFQLPHWNRVQGDQQVEAYRQLNGLAKDKKIAEITRYAKFRDLPQNVHSAMLHQMFERLSSGPHAVDIVLISVDKTSRRQFERYRPQEIGRFFPNPKSKEPEYIMYFDTHSSDFRKTLEELKIQAQSAF